MADIPPGPHSGLTRVDEVVSLLDGMLGVRGIDRGIDVGRAWLDDIVSPTPSPSNPIDRPGPPPPIDRPGLPPPIDRPGPPPPINRSGPPPLIDRLGPPSPIDRPGPLFPIDRPGPSPPVDRPGPLFPVDRPGPPPPIDRPGPVDRTGPPPPVIHQTIWRLEKHMHQAALPPAPAPGAVLWQRPEGKFGRPDHPTADRRTSWSRGRSSKLAE